MTSKAKQWHRHLEARQASGGSTAAYCREHGLSYARFMYWQRRLASRPKGLVPVTVAPSTQRAMVVKLTVPGGVAMHVEAASVEEIVSLVRGLAC